MAVESAESEKTHRVTLWLTDAEFEDLEKLQEMSGQSKPQIFYELFKARMFLVIMKWCYIPVEDFKFLLQQLNPEQLLEYSHLLAAEMSENQDRDYWGHFTKILEEWSKNNHAQFTYDEKEQTIHWKHPYGKNFSQAFFDARTILLAAEKPEKFFIWSNIGEETLIIKMLEGPRQIKSQS